MGGIRRRTLIVLGAGSAQLGAYLAATDLDLVSIGCDSDPRAFCIRLGLPVHHHDVSTMNPVAISGLARRYDAVGIIAAGTDGPVRIAADVAAQLGLPHPLDPATAARSTDKLAQRLAFAAAGVPQPAWSADGSRPSEGAVVVKPVAAQGQRGLTRVEAGGDLLAALALARAASRDGAALVEELVEGPEVTVNAFVSRGEFHAVMVADRERSDAFGVATAHITPSVHPVTAAIEAARLATLALGIELGPSYVQIVLSPDGPRVMEVAARLGGGHDGELCALTTGVRLSELAVRAAVGEEPPPILARNPCGGVVRFLLAPPGRLVRIEGIEEARALPGVQLAYVYREPGDLLPQVARGADRAGFVLATGATRDEALLAAARACETIRFVMR